MRTRDDGSTVRRFARMLLLLGLCVLQGWVGMSWAKTIKLTDQTEVTADVLQTDDDSIIMRIPRERVATVDGQPLPPVLGVGVAAPSFHAKDLAGVDQAIGPKSDHVTLLHFWVHWCPHCRSDAPQIQALHDKFHTNPNVRVLAVNLDDERQKVDQFVQEQHVTYPVIFAQEATAHGTDLPVLYQVQGFPLTYLIDERGVIRYKTVGSFVESKVDLGAKILELLPKIPLPPSPASQPVEQKKRGKRRGWW